MRVVVAKLKVRRFDLAGGWGESVFDVSFEVLEYADGARGGLPLAGRRATKRPSRVSRAAFSTSVPPLAVRRS